MSTSIDLILCERLVEIEVLLGLILSLDRSLLHLTPLNSLSYVSLQALGSVEMIEFAFPALDFISSNRVIGALILLVLGVLVSFWETNSCVYSGCLF